MRVLIACEESQEVCKAFRARGHEAYSCDLQDCSGEHPEWHIKDDILNVIKGGIFSLGNDYKQDEVIVYEWDMMIAFPPCTHLAVSGAAWFEEKRKDGRQKDGIDFFMEFTKTNIKKVCIENPVGIMSSIYRKPDQLIHPYYFGDEASKPTCLWLHGLPKLVHFKHDDLFNKKTHTGKGEFVTSSSGKRGSKWNWWLPPGPERAKIRSKTFPGIAKAMAEQWG